MSSESLDVAKYVHETSREASPATVMRDLQLSICLSIGTDAESLTLRRNTLIQQDRIRGFFFSSLVCGFGRQACGSSNSSSGLLHGLTMPHRVDVNSREYQRHHVGQGNKMFCKGNTRFYLYALMPVGK
ncbi:hypothetical protein RRG08_024072 [Elysia crispata]|uniref:Uncharacterized protein n=1 Tax=Elysia crispata TaxID=231223 RepID=A0AAE0ZQQ5_9GAST|nr:hypothetical protein RRG08_024072 [Elysia crispata]